jgi:hypothetical protein
MCVCVLVCVCVCVGVHLYEDVWLHTDIDRHRKRTFNAGVPAHMA